MHVYNYIYIHLGCLSWLFSVSLVVLPVMSIQWMEVRYNTCNIAFNAIS